jgi:hypothetical protein
MRHDSEVRGSLLTFKVTYQFDLPARLKTRRLNVSLFRNTTGVHV